MQRTEVFIHPFSHAIAIVAVLAALVAAGAAAQTGAETARSAPDSKVTVLKVRMIVGDIRYDWKDAESIPERAEGGFTAPATIASFLGIAPGDSMSASSLERRRAAAQYRLNDSGFFFNAEVFTVLAASIPGGVVVTVRVTEGFLWRFGGGEYFGYVGQDNVFGERKSWRAIAGYNLNGISWTDDCVRGSPFMYSAGVFYSNALGTDVLDYHLFEADLSAGVRPSPDLRLFLKSPVRYYELVTGLYAALELCPDTQDGAIWLPGLGAAWEASARSPRARAVVKAETSLSLPVGFGGGVYTTAEGRLSADLSAIGGPGIALSLSCGGAWPVSRGLPAYALYDLSEDPLHSVRSGYRPEELLASRFALINAEIRLPLPPLRLGSLFSVVFAPFLFTDAAIAGQPEDSANNDFEAAGAGIRIIFENPVFACFAFSYGWNPEGAGRFVFTASAKP